MYCTVCTCLGTALRAQIDRSLAPICTASCRAASPPHANRHIPSAANTRRDQANPLRPAVFLNICKRQQNSNHCYQGRSNLLQPPPYVPITTCPPWPRRQIRPPAQQTSSTRRCRSKASWSAAPASRPSRGCVISPLLTSSPLQNQTPDGETDNGTRRQTSPKRRPSWAACTSTI